MGVEQPKVTVAQLIALLATHPPDAEVLIPSGAFGAFTLADVLVYPRKP